MEVLNVVGLTPISILSEPRKYSSIPTNSLLKSSNSSKLNNTQQNISRNFHGGLVLLSSVFNAGIAKALTYEEALQQSVSSQASTDSSDFDFDVGGALDGIVNFAVENPTILAGGAAILAVPIVVSQFLKKPKSWGIESAKNAFTKLAYEGDAQLLDIRAPVEFKQVGSPDIKGLKKKAIAVTYKGDDKPGFLKKLELKFKEPENTTLFILDKFDGNSELVAELVTVNGFKAAYAIKDGVEGPRGWMNSGLPWQAPKKSLSFDLSSLSDAINGAFEGSEAVSVIIGLAAATGLGLLAFTEIETILQILGSAALLQFASKKLLFAESRKETIQQLTEFVDTKIAPQELVDEIKQIGQALLPLSVINKALPAPAETTTTPALAPTVLEETVGKAEAAPVSKPKVEEAAIEETVLKAEAALVAEHKVEETAEATTEVNSAPKTEVKPESPSGFKRSLSPYPYYPDFKPPSTPTPSRP